MTVFSPSEWCQGIAEAAERLRGKVRLTPTLAIDDDSDQPVLIKAENLQRTGAFKIRPALNNLLIHREMAVKHGVVTSSSGNFALAVAWAARHIGAHVKIVMTSQASGYKADRAAACGAEIVRCGPDYASRQEVVDRIRSETGALEIHAHDSFETVAGDGTIGMEILEQCPDVGTVVVPVSGGGLLGGIAVAIKANRPGVRLVGVQPEGNDPMVRSVEAGKRLTNDNVDTVADGLTAATPGAIGFDLVTRFVDAMVSVPDDAMLDTVRWLGENEKIHVEPAGAAAYAAVRAGLIGPVTAPIVCVASGGNSPVGRF